jgi:threonine dehydratase
MSLRNLFPEREVYAKCEFVAPSGSFKIRGADHLLHHLSRTQLCRRLVVPSMGNTALGAAAAAPGFGFSMTAVVPQSIGRAKDDMLRALNVEVIKIAGGGTDLLRQAYFVHTHLDPLWTDGYQPIADEILREVPGCRSLVFPVGGGGLLMGLSEFFLHQPARLELIGCEAYNSPTYACFDHERSTTIADGLILEEPHVKVQERIRNMGIAIELVADSAIRAAMKDLFTRQALVVEPSSAITIAFVQANLDKLVEPICVVLTGENIARADFLGIL